MPLRHHLGSYQDLGLSLLEALQDRGHPFCAGHGIAIEPIDLDAREQFRQRILDPFGSRRALMHAVALALGASIRDRLVLTAVVALGTSLALVVGERDVTLMASQVMSAAGAVQIPSKTSAVEKEQYLFVSIEGGSNPFDEPLRQ